MKLWAQCHWFLCNWLYFFKKRLFGFSSGAFRPLSLCQKKSCPTSLAGLRMVEMERERRASGSPATTKPIFHHGREKKDMELLLSGVQSQSRGIKGPVSKSCLISIILLPCMGKRIREEGEKKSLSFWYRVSWHWNYLLPSMTWKL